MLITKTPFRISFCGGGSDLPTFYRRHGGCVLSTSINKYMYISVHPYFDPDRISLKYSGNEVVSEPMEARHTIFRQVLLDMNIGGVEIVSTADVPSGTGLGSSSSFTVGLLHTLHCYQGKFISKQDLAAEACAVEIEKLGNPIGKQDQYAAACGGLNFISFHEDDSVSVEPIIMRRETSLALQENLVMFYTGAKHDANEILSEQSQTIAEAGKERRLLRMCSLAKEMKQALEENELNGFGHLLHENWLLKRELASKVSSPMIDSIYEKAMENGAAGGKLLGAGGGGFFLFYCEKYKQNRLAEALGLRPFDFRFERDGTSVVYIGDKYW